MTNNCQFCCRKSVAEIKRIDGVVTKFCDKCLKIARWSEFWPDAYSAFDSLGKPSAMESVNQ